MSLAFSVLGKKARVGRSIDAVKHRFSRRQHFHRQAREMQTMWAAAGLTSNCECTHGEGWGCASIPHHTKPFRLARRGQNPRFY